MAVDTVRIWTISPFISCFIFIVYWQIIVIYLTVIGVHEVHGRMHPNYCQITILLVLDLSSSLIDLLYDGASLPIAGKLPIKTLVARQLPTSNYIDT